jgi:hypothetical protein
LIAPTTGTGFAELRNGQEAALQRYAAADYTKADLAIELPTGAGKSLIALLVLEYWRKHGKRVAILTGNKTLARQIEIEGNALGVPIVRFEGRGRDFSPGDLRKYRRGHALAVMNYWVYIQQNPAVESADYIVLDDAQLAEGALISLHTVNITRGDHKILFDQLMREIERKTPSPVANTYVKEIVMDPGGFRPVDLLTFPHFDRVLENIEVLVDEYLQAKPDGESDAVTDLHYRWSRVHPLLRRCVCLLSADEIELRPISFPTRKYDLLAAATQRLYMSATLHDPSDLQRRLGTWKISKLDIPATSVEAQDGRRLFVFNQHAPLGVRNQVSEDVLSPLRELLAVAKKSVWLCTSAFEADVWEKWLANGGRTDAELARPDGTTTTPDEAAVRAIYGQKLWRLSSTGDEIEAFAQSEEGHLLIAGRFEGMDFPDDVCRLAVLPSVPTATGLLERFTSEQLRDASYQRMRMLERIKQGIGRCTRGDKDYAIYYFLDPRFYTEMESGDFGSIVSERTRRQIELGLALTEDGMGSVVPFARPFLHAHFSEFDRQEQGAEPPRLKPEHVEDVTADEEVIGWLALFAHSSYSEAARRFEKVVSGLGNTERERRAFWLYQQAFAEFLRHTEDEAPEALDRTLKLLDEAIKEGASSSWFNRLARAANVLRTSRVPLEEPQFDRVFDVWDTLVERYPYHSGRFLRWQSRLQSHLAGTHNQVAEAIEVMGMLLGFTASRPPGNGAADGLWIDHESAITFEAKIETSRNEVILADVNQADGQRRAAAQTLALAEEAVDGLIVTNLRAIHSAAGPALGRVRIITMPVLEQLRHRIQDLLAEYWRTWSASDAQARLAARRSVALRLPQSGWLSRAVANSAGPFLTEAELFSEWP